MKNHAREIWNSVRYKSWRVVVTALQGPTDEKYVPWEAFNNQLSILIWNSTYLQVMNPLDELLHQLEEQRRQFTSETDDGRLPRER